MITEQALRQKLLACYADKFGCSEEQAEQELNYGPLLRDMILKFGRNLYLEGISSGISNCKMCLISKK